MANNGLWSAFGGLPGDFDPGTVDPTAIADFWNRIAAQREADARTTEIPKNDKTPAPAVTPGPEAFKQNPSAGATDLEGMNLSPDARTRAITAAMEPVLGGVQLGARAAQGLASGFGYYPNETSEALGKASEAVGQTADQFKRAGEEQSRRAGYSPEAVSLLHPSTWDPARTAGSLLSPANLAAGRVGGAAADALIPMRAAVPATALYAAQPARNVLANTMAKGAGSSVAIGAVQPVAEKPVSPNAPPGEQALQHAENTRNYWMTKLKQGGVDAILGAGIPLAAGKGGEIIGGIVPENVRTLIDASVRLTPGQIAGGALQHLESLMESLPITGWAIRGAKGRGQEDLPYAMSSRALREAGEAPLPRGTTGGDLMDGTYKGMQRAYDRALTGAQAPMDRSFYGRAHLAMYNAGVADLPPDMQRSLARFVDRTITNRTNNAMGTPLDGQAIKEIESDLTKQIRKFGKSGEPYNQDMAHVLESLRTTFMEHVRDSSPPGVRQQIARANAGYVTFKQLQRAADTTAQAAADARMTPGRLAHGVHSGDPSVGNRLWTEHNVKNQDLSDAAQQVMRNFSNSGTTDRAMAMAMLHGLVAGGGHAAGAGAGAGIPLAADMAGALVYSRPGQALLQYMMTAGGREGQARHAIGRAVQDYAPYAGNVGLQSDAAQEELRNRTAPINPELKSFGGATTPEAAGKAFFAQGTDIAGAKRSLGTMTPAQRAEFSTGYAGNLTNHIMASKDPRTALNTWTASPKARQHMEAALGPNRAHQLEAVMRLEGLQGLAPFMASGDNAVRLGAPNAIPNYNELLMHAVHSGGAAIGKKFDPASVARTAALLSSTDPEQYARGVKQFSNSSMLDAMRAYDKDLVKRGLTQPSFLRNDSEKTAGTVTPGAVVPPSGMGPTEQAAMQAAEDRTQPPKAQEKPPTKDAVRVPGLDGWYKHDAKTGKYFAWRP